MHAYFAISMFQFADKFGSNKHEYGVGALQNVSIVHYDAHVAKEDRGETKWHQMCDSIYGEPFQIWVTLEFWMVVSVILSFSIQFDLSALFGFLYFKF